MDIRAFRNLLFTAIERQENACVYEHSCTEKEGVFSVYIGNNCFSVRCTQTASEKPHILR